ncbi:MAG: ABC transporter permease [Thiothrix sp.]|nr:ABC transporter permease [Thiothrix sp.]
MALFALLEWALNDADPYQQNLIRYFAAPSWQEPLGTDQFGRDMLARLGAAVRLSFALSLLCVVSAASIGTLLGVVAVWGGRSADTALNLLVNTLMALPGLVLVLLLAALVPGSFLMLYLALSLILWVEYFRVVRAISFSLKSSPQLQASYLLGFGRWYLFRRHVWPNIAPAIITLAAFGAANSIMAMAAVGFVYVGLKPPTAELGLMIVELFPYYSDAPWVLAQPLLVIFLLVLGFNWLAGRRHPLANEN